jgi:transcriptional regulator with XRE-family HTH domain
VTTRLGAILRERNATYTSVADRAHLQPRTVRQLATGETPIDNVAVGTLRRIAAVLDVPITALIEPEMPFPGDRSLSRGARLSAAVRAVMWPQSEATYPSPVEHREPDEIATTPPEIFLADMSPIDARRG